jgi:cold shock CspA family protein
VLAGTDGQQSSSSPDIFVHKNDIQSEGEPSLTDGHKIAFTMTFEKNKAKVHVVLAVCWSHNTCSCAMQAKNVTEVDGSVIKSTSRLLKRSLRFVPARFCFSCSFWLTCLAIRTSRQARSNGKNFL